MTTKKSGQVDVALLFSKNVIVMDGVKFEFNDIISLYKKNGQLAYYITKYI